MLLNNKSKLISEEESDYDSSNEGMLEDDADHEIDGNEDNSESEMQEESALSKLHTTWSKLSPPSKQTDVINKWVCCYL